MDEDEQRELLKALMKNLARCDQFVADLTSDENRGATVVHASGFLQMLSKGKQTGIVVSIPGYGDTRIHADHVGIVGNVFAVGLSRICDVLAEKDGVS